MASRHKNIPIKLFKTPVLFLIKLFVEILTLRLEKSLSGEESLLLFQSSSSNTQVKTLTSSRGPTASFDCYGCLHTHVTLKTHTFIYINKNKIKNKSSLEHWLALEPSTLATDAGGAPVWRQPSNCNFLSKNKNQPMKEKDTIRPKLEIMKILGNWLKV